VNPADASGDGAVAAAAADGDAAGLALDNTSGTADDTGVADASDVAVDVVLVL
jgi:hypothetical protein